MKPSSCFIIPSIGALVTILLANVQALAAGGIGTGGGNPKIIDAESVQEFFMGDQSGHGLNYLKLAMLNYLKTISLEQIDDPIAKNILESSPGIDAIKKDIQNSHYITDPKVVCKDEFNNDMPASAGISEVGGDICFNVAKLALEYKDLDATVAMMKLAALAFHEHVHHFQAAPNGDRGKIAALEGEANRLAAYVYDTSQSGEIPTIKWIPRGAAIKEQASNGLIANTGAVFTRTTDGMIRDPDGNLWTAPLSKGGKPMEVTAEIGFHEDTLLQRIFGSDLCSQRHGLNFRMAGPSDFQSLRRLLGEDSIQGYSPFAVDGTEIIPNLSKLDFWVVKGLEDTRFAGSGYVLFSGKTGVFHYWSNTSELGAILCFRNKPWDQQLSGAN